MLFVLAGLALPSGAAGPSDADAKLLVEKLVQALNSRDSAALKSIYHRDLWMTVCNSFERLVGHVVFGDDSDTTFENLQASSASLIIPPKIAGPSPVGRVPVIFAIRWAYASRVIDGPSGELSLAIRWEVGSVGGSWKVMRQYSQPCGPRP